VTSSRSTCRILDAEQVLDYSELIHRAVILAQQPQVQAKLRAEFKAVFVDEYQDTDPGQTKLLQAIAGDWPRLWSSSAIRTSRSTRSAGPTSAVCCDSPRSSRHPTARKPHRSPLGTTRRFGTTLQRVSRNVVNRLGVPGQLDRDTFDRFPATRMLRRLFRAREGRGQPYSTSGAELEHIADLLRRAHVQDGVGVGTRWPVLVPVRQPVHPAVAAVRWPRPGIPVDVAGDELPLSREPAVRPMLLALRAVADPATLTVDVVRALALSPLGRWMRGSCGGWRAYCGDGIGRLPAGSGCRGRRTSCLREAFDESAAARRGGVAGRGTIRGPWANGCSRQGTS